MENLDKITAMREMVWHKEPVKHINPSGLREVLENEEFAFVRQRTFEGEHYLLILLLNRTLRDHVIQACGMSSNVMDELWGHYVEIISRYVASGGTHEYLEESALRFLRNAEKHIDVSHGLSEHDLRHEFLEIIKKESLLHRPMGWKKDVDSNIFKLVKAGIARCSFEYEVGEMSYTHLLSAQHSFKEGEKRIGAIVQALKKHFGYCDECARKCITVCCLPKTLKPN